MAPNIVPAAPHQVPPTKIHATVIAIAKRRPILNQNRQNHARLLPTTSASRRSELSTPNRLGQGMTLRNMRSANPRKTITIASDARTDCHQFHPTCCENQTKRAGSVMTATTVATRVRRRQESARSRDDSPVGSVVSGRVVVIAKVYAGCPAADVQRSLSDPALLASGL